MQRLKVTVLCCVVIGTPLGIHGGATATAT